jgi:hypothetical protein
MPQLPKESRDAPDCVILINHDFDSNIVGIVNCVFQVRDGSRSSSHSPFPSANTLSTNYALIPKKRNIKTSALVVIVAAIACWRRALVLRRYRLLELRVGMRYC